MVSAFLVYALVDALGISVAISAYVAVVFGAGVVTVLEFVIPYDRSWQPDRRDVKNDLIFMVTVQMVLPQILTLLVGIGLIKYLRATEWPIALWPHELPLVGQVALMLLVAELFRYWLHVASHNTNFLWRFHAVHHSPHKLYWLNVGHSHPVEKAVQYMLDMLPFILVGVSETVLALYFVFYAVNGFFQHSNVDARYGVLNYVVSGAELHRWHHSKRIEESNRNYGNNLILWDLIFGSWFLPRDRRVGELGLMNRSYPLDFTSQARRFDMKKLLIVVAAVASVPTVLSAQQRLNPTEPQPSCYMCEGGYVPVAEIEAYTAKAMAEGLTDQQIPAHDIGKGNVGIGVVYRGKLDEPRANSVAEHDLVSEVYHVISGSATIVLGPDIVDRQRRSATMQTVIEFNGPGNGGADIRNGVAYDIKAGDVVIIPAGTGHWFQKIDDHINYLMVRFDPDKVTPLRDEERSREYLSTPPRR